MHECDHCGASFDEEDAYLRHLRDDHPDDLSRIEQRRVDGLDDGGGGIPTVAVVGAAAVGVLIAGALAYLLLGSGGGTADAEITPHSQGSVHYHGTMNVTIDGQTLDFSKDEYQYEDDFFHYERGNGDRWHVHGEDVSLEYGLATLGIDVTENSVTFDGTTYEDGDEGTNVTITVNGESVDPAQYVLKRGDQVRVIVTTE